MFPSRSDQSPLVVAFAILVAVVAVVGTGFFGWEWGSDQVVPTVIGVGVAAIAVALVVRERLR